MRRVEGLLGPGDSKAIRAEGQVPPFTTKKGSGCHAALERMTLFFLENHRWLCRTLAATMFALLLGGVAIYPEYRYRVITFELQNVLRCALADQLAKPWWAGPPGGLLPLQCDSWYVPTQSGGCWRIPMPR